jgi:hypothetical protein
VKLLQSDLNPFTGPSGPSEPSALKRDVFSTDFPSVNRKTPNGRNPSHLRQIDFNAEGSEETEGAAVLQAADWSFILNTQSHNIV